MFSVLGKMEFVFKGLWTEMIDSCNIQTISNKHQQEKNTEYVKNTVYCRKQGYTCQMREDSVSG